MKLWCLLPFLCLMMNSQLAAMECVQLLFEAVKSANADGIYTLIRKSAPINCRDAKGRTPLHIAAELDDKIGEPIVRGLIAAGATVQIYDRFLCQPIHCAALGENWKIFDVLEQREKQEKEGERIRVPSLMILCCRAIANHGINWRAHKRVPVPVRDMLDARAWVPYQEPVVDADDILPAGSKRAGGHSLSIGKRARGAPRQGRK